MCEKRSGPRQCTTIATLWTSSALMSLLVLSAADVTRVATSFTPDELQMLMARVFVRLSSKDGIALPHRTTISTSQHTVLFMPSRLQDIGTAIKVVSVPTSPYDSRGLPATTMVMDEESGCIQAVINAKSLTALRNAAGMFSICFPYVSRYVARVYLFPHSLFLNTKHYSKVLSSPADSSLGSYPRPF